MFSKTALFSAASLLLTIPFTTAAPTNCMAAVRVISVRGSNEPFGGSVLREVFSSILFKGMNAVLQGTPYPAQMGSDAVYGNSVTTGVYSLQGIIKSAVEQCPNQKIVLMGYSQGAEVIGDALCSSTASTTQQLSSQYADNIKAIVLWGDPAHVVGQSFVEGPGAEQNGMVPRYNNPQCAPYTDRIRSYCHQDTVCATGAGFQWQEHLNYFDGGDNTDAASFVLSKVR